MAMADFERFRTYVSDDPFLAKVLADPAGRRAFDELNADWFYHQERGRQKAFLADGRDSRPWEEVTTTFEEWPPDVGPLRPGFLFKIGGVLARVSFVQDLDVSGVTAADPYPYDVYDVELFDDGAGRPLKVADAPDWLFDAGGMPVPLYDNGNGTYVARSGVVLRTTLKTLSVPRRLRHRRKLLSTLIDGQDRFRYLNRLRELGIVESSRPLKKPEWELMLRYPNYDAFEEAVDEWGANLKKPEVLLEAYRSEFRGRPAPAGVARVDRSGDVMYVAVGPNAEARAVEVQRERERQEAEAARQEAESRAHGEVARFSAALAPGFRKSADYKFLPGITVKVTIMDLVVDVDWGDRPPRGRQHETYRAHIRGADGVPYGLHGDRAREWLQWEPSVRLLQATERLKDEAGDMAGSLVREGAILAMFFPSDTQIVATRLDPGGKEQIIVVGWCYAFADQMDRRGYGVYRSTDLRTLTALGDTPQEPVVELLGATPQEALAAWIRGPGKMFTNFTMTTPIMEAAVAEVAAEVAAAAATAERIKREGFPGWKQFEELPELPGLGEKPPENAAATFYKMYVKTDNFVLAHVAGERWVLPIDPNKDPEVYGSIYLESQIARREPDQSIPFPAQFDPTGPKLRPGRRPQSDFLKQFAEPVGPCIPTHATLGAKTVDALVLVTEGYSGWEKPGGGMAGIQPLPAGKLRIFGGGSYVEMPLAFAIATDSHRLHGVGLSEAPPRTIDTPLPVGLGGGPVWPVGARAALSPYFAWETEASRLPDWANLLENDPEKLLYATIPVATLKAWARAANPGKKGQRTPAGDEILRVSRTPSMRPAVYDPKKNEFTMPWVVETRAAKDDRLTSILPGVEWDDGGEGARYRARGEFGVMPAYLMQLAGTFLLANLPVRMAYKGALSPILFYQTASTGKFTARVVQFHILMTMRLN